MEYKVSVPLRGLYPYKMLSSILLSRLYRYIVSVPLRGLYPYKFLISNTDTAWPYIKVSVPLRGLYPYKTADKNKSDIASMKTTFQSPCGDYTLIRLFEYVYYRHLYIDKVSVPLRGLYPYKERQQNL